MLIACDALLARFDDGATMTTLTDYEAWKSGAHKIASQSRLDEWLRNEPVTYPSTAEYIARWALLLVAAIAIFFLCRRALRNAKPVLVYVVVRAVVAWKAVLRFFDDLRQQVSAGVAAHAERAERPRIQAERTSTEPSRFALAGRMFFNLGVAPLLLAVALAGIAWIVSQITG